MSKRTKATCSDCYFRRAGLCALPGETACPTFRLEPRGTLAPPRAAAARAAAARRPRRGVSSPRVRFRKKPPPSIGTRTSSRRTWQPKLYCASIVLILLAAYAIAFVLENRKSVPAPLRLRDRERLARLADPARPRGGLRRRDPAVAARASTPAPARRAVARASRETPSAISSAETKLKASRSERVPLPSGEEVGALHERDACRFRAREQVAAPRTEGRAR